MSELEIKTIKEEMRRALLYYATTHKTVRAVGDLISENGYVYSEISEKMMDEIRGKIISYIPISQYTDSSYIIKKIIQEKYEKAGHKELAQRAYSQVNETYLIAGMKKYKLNYIEAPKVSISVNHEKKKNEATASRVTIVAGIILFIICGTLLSNCYGWDTRSEREKGVSAYCIHLGKTC